MFLKSRGGNFAYKIYDIVLYAESVDEFPSHCSEVGFARTSTLGT